MTRRADLVGQKFGRLLVEKYDFTQGGRAHWKCRCDCGAYTSVSSYSLRSGNTKSCGCYRKEVVRKNETTHGGRYTKLYSIWTAMKKRCNSPNDIGYKNYGGRGISVCSQWSDFKRFREWAIFNGYQEGLTIERINNDGNYEPSNCRWATRKEQARNRRSNVKVTIDGKTKLLTDWPEELGLSYQTISDKYVKKRKNLS